MIGGVVGIEARAGFIARYGAVFECRVFEDGSVDARRVATDSGKAHPIMIRGSSPAALFLALAFFLCFFLTFAFVPITSSSRESWKT